MQERRLVLLRKLSFLLARTLKESRVQPWLTLFLEQLRVWRTQLVQALLLYCSLCQGQLLRSTQKAISNLDRGAKSLEAAKTHVTAAISNFATVKGNMEATPKDVVDTAKNIIGFLCINTTALIEVQLIQLL